MQKVPIWWSVDDTYDTCNWVCNFEIKKIKNQGYRKTKTQYNYSYTVNVKVNIYSVLP